MKKDLKLSLTFMIFGLAGGVFYREFTKAYGFTARTMLGNVHVHFIGLGMILFLLTALLNGQLKLEGLKSYRIFRCLYVIGMMVSGILMWVRGTLEVTGTVLQKGLDAGLSGIAGLGHMTLTAGLILLFVSLFKALKNQ